MSAQASTIERQARRLWLTDTTDRRFGSCDGCGRVRDAEDKPILVARQRGRRVFECLECFDTGRAS